MISYTHVLVAMVAAKFLNCESIFQRRVGVLLFEVFLSLLIISFYLDVLGFISAGKYEL
jgi:hypothetical protein